MDIKPPSGIASGDQTLYETFDGTSLDLSKWALGWNSTTATPLQPTKISFSSGIMRLDYFAGDPAWDCPAIHSAATFDLRDKFVIYEIASATTDIQAEVGIIKDDDHIINAYINAGMINVYSRDGGGNVWGVAAVFDPTAKFIRIRHQTSDNRYYIDFSSNKISWTPLHDLAAFAGLDPATAELTIGACHSGGVANDDFQVTAVYTDAQ